MGYKTRFKGNKRMKMSSGRKGERRRKTSPVNNGKMTKMAIETVRFSEAEENCKKVMIFLLTLLVLVSINRVSFYGCC